MNMIKKLTMVMLMVILASPAMAGVFEDGTMDLWIFLAGKTTAVDVGFAGAGVEFVLDPESGRGIEVNASPTYFSLDLGMCKIPWVKDKLGCGEA